MKREGEGSKLYGEFLSKAIVTKEGISSLPETRVL